MTNMFASFKDSGAQNIFAITHVAHNPGAYKNNLGLAPG
jgi:hypothetical protein